MGSKRSSSPTSSRTLKEGEQPEIVPTKITVTEGKHRKVNFGVGYGSEERARGSIDWRHVNFFGGARTMQFIGQASRLDRGVRVNFRQPYCLRAATTTCSLSGQRGTTTSRLHAQHDGGSVTVERTLARRGPLAAPPTTTVFLNYTNEYQSYQRHRRRRSTIRRSETI